MTGRTGILGIRKKAHIVPGKNQTVGVSDAVGTCGGAAGQVAKMLAISRLQYTGLIRIFRLKLFSKGLYSNISLFV